jgi:hypothetical protein
VIILSDGQENTGEGSLKVAAALAEKYGVCFHTISFADTVNGNQELLDGITNLKSCGVGASAAQLADDAALQKFVRTCSMKQPAPPRWPILARSTTTPTA